MSPLLLLTLLACGPEPEPEAEPIDGLSLDVRQPGPFSAGYRLLHTTYDPGLGEGERSLDLHVWYPTESTDFDEVAYTYEVFTDAEVVPDAPLAPSAYGGSYPVQAYSHGDRGFGGSSAFLARHFATHGWVTIAPDHVDNLTFDNVEPRPTSLYAHRPMDITAALDALEADEVLGAVAATDRVVLSAHSFGNYTTWAAGGSTFEAVDSICAPEAEDCTQAEYDAFSAGFGDPRIVATVPMAGVIYRSWFGDGGHRTQQGPVLFMSGTEDPIGQQTHWDEMDTLDFTWLEIQGACHHAFALGGCFDLPTDEGHAIVHTYALAFARTHVLDDASVVGILDGSEVVDERVAFQRMNAR
ncbi:MAG: hypothetical protein EP330_15950 [Deltaproteobacteria bacterium]|nr:MAG: hypothetical protein EP330_15950 [Deltaproteobacteria bacterium]